VAASQRYLGAWSAFGEIIEIENCLYNPIVKVRANDGSISFHQLPKLIALGLSKDTTHARPKYPHRIKNP
jgi:hypothetical protein